MAEKLRLKTEAGKHKVRLHIISLIVLVIVALAGGYVAGQKGIITGKATQDNCIPQTEFQFFLDGYNSLQDQYKKCVSDVWTLQLACKTGKIATIPAKPTNSSK